MRIAPPEILSVRVRALRQTLARREISGLVVTSLPNIAYLTGFFASAATLVVTPDTLVLIGDGRYAEALKSRADACPFIHTIELEAGSSYDQALVEVLSALKGLTIGFEANHLTVRRHHYVAAALADRAWQSPLVDTDGMIEGLRACKDAWEIGRLREGAGRLSTVAKCILSKALAGRAESDVAAEVDLQLRRAGFERPAFDTIVAAGPNGALPHGRAGRRQIQSGDLVVLDFGGVLDGYCTDLTRTVTAGPGGARERQLIDHVIDAQAAAFAAVTPGGPPEAVDAAARETFVRHGIAAAFTHGTGHGLGLEVHEAPRVTRARPDHPEPPLAAGMVLTLEPGVYFPGWGGVRIEDDVLVTTGGAEWLTDVPRSQ